MQPRKQYNYNVYRSIPSRFLSELPKKNCKLIQVSEKNIPSKNKLPQYINKDFIVGDKVSHKDFGIGIILGVSENKLQIRFEKSNEIVKIFSDFVSKVS